MNRDKAILLIKEIIKDQPKLSDEIFYAISSVLNELSSEDFYFVFEVIPDTENWGYFFERYQASFYNKIQQLIELSKTIRSISLLTNPSSNSNDKELIKLAEDLKEIDYKNNPYELGWADNNCTNCKSYCYREKKHFCNFTELLEKDLFNHCKTWEKMSVLDLILRGNLAA